MTGLKHKNHFSLSLYCFVFFFCFSNTAISQTLSNIGTDFWVGHLGHIDGTGSNFKLYISSTVNTSGTVSVPLQGWSMPFTITANTFAIIQVPSGIGYVGCSDCIAQKGIHIVANDDIAVYAHIYASARSDATLLLPTVALSKEYYVTTFTQASGYRSEFLVVAPENNTQVQITPSAATIGGQPANVPFTVTLQQGEIYQVQSNTDLTGSKVRSLNSDSCKGVAVFAGSTWTTVGCSNAGSGDNLYEQMFPVNTWGRNFITSPFKDRSGDIFRVVAGSANTSISIDGVTKNLNQGQFFDTLLFNASYITSNKPITVAQYARTSNCDGQTGDPLMIILNPVEQNINNVLLYNSPEQDITGNYINIIMKTADIGTCLLDGSPVTFNPVPSNPVYSYSRNTVSAGSHTITADSGFNAVVYGFGSPESYGYLAGTNIRNLEYADFTINPHPACNGSTISFTEDASYEPASWYWDFGDSTTSSVQNPTHIYADTGTYLVTLITSYPNGCDAQQDTATHWLYVHGNINVNFSAPAVCLGEAITFTDSSSNPFGGVSNSWNWHFGDNTTASGQNTSHTYTQCDTFSVKLIVASDNGCTDSISKNVIVHCLPTANFGINAVCFNEPSVYTDSSHSHISLWNWNFGDGSTINTDSTPGYTYTAPGIYTTTLTVTSIYGCSDSIAKTAQVYPAPQAGFTVNDVCIGDSVYFTNTSSIASPGSIDSYLWIFGDGSQPDNTSNPAHLYNSPGTYPVTLLVKTTDSCTGVVTMNVNVFDTPLANFTANNSCLYDSVLFSNNSQNPSNGTIGSWEWNFGDGSSADSVNWNPSHLYNTHGSYEVALIVYSSNLGCPDTLKDSVTIYPIPLANFSATEICHTTPTDFQDSSSVFNGSITNWQWNFGDNSTVITTQHPSHTYTNFGQFTVTVTVTTNNGCIDSTTQNIFVHPLPDALFTANNVCDGATVIFTGNSTIPANPTNDVIQQWFWSIGDGTTASTQNTTHLYSSAGSYPVQLNVTTSFGCVDSVSKTITVNPNPVALFTTNDTSGCSPLCASFQNASSVPGGGGIITWLWSFGDGTTSNSQEVQHCYNNTNNTPQTFSPSLTVTSDSGCVTSLTINNYITVFPVPDAQFLASPQTVTSTNPVISIINTSLIATLWNWNFGDSLTDNSQYPPPHTYTDTGTYIITLIASTAYGCYDTAYTTVIVEPDFMFYVPNAFTPNGDGINDGFTGAGTYVKEFEMFIFDRWGNLIYKTDDINKPWNGTANDGNEIAQQDVYVYLIKANDFRGKEHKYRGMVTLIR